MKSKASPPEPGVSAVTKQVEGFVDKFTLAHRKRIRSARRLRRKRMPAAHESVYDSYNFFVEQRPRRRLPA